MSIGLSRMYGMDDVEHKKIINENANTDDRKVEEKTYFLVLTKEDKNIYVKLFKTLEEIPEVTKMIVLKQNATAQDRDLVRKTIEAIKIF